MRGWRARVFAVTGMVLMVSLALAGGAQAVATRCPGAATYPGDAASPTELAVWMGRSVQGTGLPWELPVMAALVQSGLHNMQGDPDSVGYFQIRTDIWDQGDYAGFGGDPAIQMRWFIDLAVAVRQGAKNDGAGFRADPASWGAWIAGFDRPDDPGFGAERYQARLAEARQLLRAGCARVDRAERR